MSAYNLRNPAVKRLMREAEELRYPTKEYHAQPLEDNLFEWHFTISGPPNTEFEGGIYHGRITLPPDYPMKPPSIILLTPNGRFETNKKICLSISGYHPESWQPSWSIRTALLAIIGFLPTHGNGAIGSLDYTPEERKELALKSQGWKCVQCGLVKQYLAEKEEKSLKENPVTSTVKTETIYMKDTVTTSTESNNVCSGNENSGNTKQDIEIPQANILSISNETLAPNDSMPSSSHEKESSLRQRQPISTPKENNQTNVINNATRSSSNWSLGAIWVIVILLAILVFRRIICQ